MTRSATYSAMPSLMPPPGQDHLGSIADLLRLVSQVVRIDADAVPADEAGPEVQEIPLRPGRLQYLFGIDAEPVEDL